MQTKSHELFFCKLNVPLAGNILQNFDNHSDKNHSDTELFGSLEILRNGVCLKLKIHVNLSKHLFYVQQWVNRFRTNKPHAIVTYTCSLQAYSRYA